MWQRCAKALDPERLDQPEFGDTQARLANRDDLVEALSNVTRRLSAAEIVDRLSKAKVNVAKVNSVGEAADHPQLVHAGGVVEFSLNGEAVKAVATPFRLSRTPTTVSRPPPLRVGGATDEVLAEMGFSVGEITSLRAEGAFGKAPASP